MHLSYLRLCLLCLCLLLFLYITHSVKCIKENWRHKLIMGLGFSAINFSVDSAASFYNTGQLSSLRSYPLEISHYMYLHSISSISRCFHLSYLTLIPQRPCDADIVTHRSPKLRDLLKTMKLVEKLKQKIPLTWLLIQRFFYFITKSVFKESAF